MLVLILYLRLDDLELGLHVRVMYVSLRMQLGQVPQSFLMAVVVDEPPWRLGKQVNTRSQSDSRNQLQPKPKDRRINKCTFTFFALLRGVLLMALTGFSIGHCRRYFSNG
jgi:hypothetical protein